MLTKQVCRASVGINLDGETLTGCFPGHLFVPSSAERQRNVETDREARV